MSSSQRVLRLASSMIIVAAMFFFASSKSVAQCVYDSIEVFGRPWGASSFGKVSSRNIQFEHHYFSTITDSLVLREFTDALPSYPAYVAEIVEDPNYPSDLVAFLYKEDRIDTLYFASSEIMVLKGYELATVDKLLRIIARTIPRKAFEIGESGMLLPEFERLFSCSECLLRIDSVREWKYPIDSTDPTAFGFKWCEERTLLAPVSITVLANELAIVDQANGNIKFINTATGGIRLCDLPSPDSGLHVWQATGFKDGFRGGLAMTMWSDSLYFLSANCRKSMSMYIGREYRGAPQRFVWPADSIVHKHGSDKLFVWVSETPDRPEQVLLVVDPVGREIVDVIPYKTPLVFPDDLTLEEDNCRLDGKNILTPDGVVRLDTPMMPMDYAPIFVTYRDLKLASFELNEKGEMLVRLRYLSRGS